MENKGHCELLTPLVQNYFVCVSVCVCMHVYVCASVFLTPVLQSTAVLAVTQRVTELGFCSKSLLLCLFQHAGHTHHVTL